MKKNIINWVHTNKGGAYKVAQQYASFFEGPVLVGRFRFSILKCDAVFCHNLFLAVIAALFGKFTGHRTLLVEHYVITSLLKFELTSSMQRFKFFSLHAVFRFLGGESIVLDRVALRLRSRLLPGKQRVYIVGNSMDESCSKQNRDSNYDLVWAAGLSKQKKWPAVKNLLVSFAEFYPSKRILFSSYDDLDPVERTALEDAKIVIAEPGADWAASAKCFFFTSNYEGLPLAPFEAARRGVKVIVWSDAIVKRQLGVIDTFWRHRDQNFTPADLNETLALSNQYEATFSKKLISQCEQKSILLGLIYGR